MANFFNAGLRHRGVTSVVEGIDTLAIPRFLWMDPSPTPTTADAMASRPPRVLVVYGSESGSTKRLITKITKTWKARGATFPEPDIMTGNDAIVKYSKLEVRIA